VCDLISNSPFFLFLQENCILYVVKAEPVKMRFISNDASKIRKLLWRIIISDHFENLIILFVTLNTISLAMEVCFLFVEIFTSCTKLLNCFYFVCFFVYPYFFPSFFKNFIFNSFSLFNFLMFFFNLKLFTFL
jgi:hypothetical protein